MSRRRPWSDPAATPLDRWDALSAIAIAIATAALLAATFDGQPALGDSGESIAGIDSLGVLHAPGYPSYVLIGWVFTRIVAIGDMGVRVALFSAACTTATAAVVFLLSRRLGASRTGAVTGALVLATGTSVWFYGGYAKHYALSGLLVAGALLCADSARNARRPLVAHVGAGLLLGACYGASWQLAALATPPVVALLLWPWPRSWRNARFAAAAAAAAVVVAYGYVLVRAGQDPAVNWGDASAPDRLVDLVTMRDFGFGGSSFVTGGGDGRRGLLARGPLRAMLNLSRYVIVTARESSWLALVAASAGGVACWRAGRRRTLTIVGGAVILNLLAAAAQVGLGPPRGFRYALSQGGFLLVAFIGVAVLVAFGVTALERAVAGRAPRFGLVAAAAVSTALLLPSVLVHHSYADHDVPPYADAYAAELLDPLPRGATLFVWGAERAFPVLHRQVVDGRRSDVRLVYAEALGHEAYRNQLAERIEGLPAHTSLHAPTQAALDARALASQGPVYLDPLSTLFLGEDIGFRFRGLAAEVRDEPGHHPPPSLQPIERTVERLRAAGIYTHASRLRWPHYRLEDEYARFHLQVARAYQERDDVEGLERHLRLTLRVEPDNELARRNLELLRETERSQR